MAEETESDKINRRVTGAAVEGTRAKVQALRGRGQGITKEHNLGVMGCHLESEVVFIEAAEQPLTTPETLP